MMSKERELLKVALDFLDPKRWLDSADQHVLNIITRDIEELLAQPEREPINLDKVDKHLEICDLSEDYRKGYSDGIVFAEIENWMRGII